VEHVGGGFLKDPLKGRQVAVHRTLEAIFRRPIRLLALIVLIPLASIAVVYFFTPRTYQSTASLWALHRYEVIGATGSESDLTSTPAQTQATALTDLLQTRTFALAIAHGTDLASTLDLAQDVLANPQRLNDALFGEISKYVIATPQGSNLIVITYTNRNPLVAQQVLKVVIQNYGSQSTAFAVSEAHQLLAGFQTGLASAQAVAQASAQAEAQYIAAHPNLTPQQLAADPQYGLLHAKALQDQTNVQSIQENINTINQEVDTQGASVESLFQIIDAPLLPIQPVSRLKQYLLSGGVGLAGGLLACALYIVILVRRDRAVYMASDLQKVTTLPLVMVSPHLTPTLMSLLLERPRGSSARHR
jgi:uncharacterized protein involved in exopolysaccharide biosynthesis